MNEASSPPQDSSTGQMVMGVQCGCRVIPWKDSGYSIEPCPLHAHADDLLEALKGLVGPVHADNCMLNKGLTACDCGARAKAREVARNLIAQAEQS